MPHYMFTGRYTTDSIKVLVANPEDREVVARKLCESLGGKLVSAYMVMGQDDFILIHDSPDDKTAAAFALALGAGGGLSGGATTKLLAISEAVAAMKLAQTASYAPPRA